MLPKGGQHHYPTRDGETEALLREVTRQKWPDRLVTGLEGAQVCLAPCSRMCCTQIVS